MTTNINNYLKTNLPDSKKIFFNNEYINKHNTLDNCYVGINGKVYNLTQYSDDYKIKYNKLPELGITCGSILDIDQTKIFGTEDYNKYEIGYIKYYLLKKIIYLILFFILYLIFVYLGFFYKSIFSIFFTILVVFMTFKILFWLYLKYKFMIPISFDKYNHI
jgi:hypothetical protein